VARVVAACNSLPHRLRRHPHLRRVLCRSRSKRWYHSPRRPPCRSPRRPSCHFQPQRLCRFLRRRSCQFLLRVRCQSRSRRWYHSPRRPSSRSPRRPLSCAPGLPHSMRQCATTPTECVMPLRPLARLLAASSTAHIAEVARVVAACNSLPHRLRRHPHLRRVLCRSRSKRWYHSPRRPSCRSPRRPSSFAGSATRRGTSAAAAMKSVTAAAAAPGAAHGMAAPRSAARGPFAVQASRARTRRTWAASFLPPTAAS